MNINKEILLQKHFFYLNKLYQVCSQAQNYYKEYFDQVKQPFDFLLFWNSKTSQNSKLLNQFVQKYPGKRKIDYYNTQKKYFNLQEMPIESKEGRRNRISQQQKIFQDVNQEFITYSQRYESSKRRLQYMKNNNKSYEQIKMIQQNLHMIEKQMIGYQNRLNNLKNNLPLGTLIQVQLKEFNSYACNPFNSSQTGKIYDKEQLLQYIHPKYCKYQQIMLEQFQRKVKQFKSNQRDRGMWEFIEQKLKKGKIDLERIKKNSRVLVDLLKQK